MCAECEEPYATTEQNGDCITRVDCSKWLHELCTVYGDRCNLLEKTRKISDATHPPTVQHLNTPSGEMAKKSNSEKWKTIVFAFPYDTIISFPIFSIVLSIMIIC
jgi:hypothetical protein